MSFQCATAPNVVFPTREALHEHYKSEWHRYNLRRRAAGLAPIAQEVFDKVRALAASQEKQGEARVRKQDHVKNKKREEEDDESKGSGAEDEAPRESMETRVRKAIEEYKPDPCRCIWDSHVSATVEENLDYMHRHHGFVVPDLASVKDLPALLNYLAEKVNVGRICLFCEREFKTGSACVSHMTSKGHCRIPWEYEDQVEEYMDYYDFTAAEQEAALQGSIEVDASTGEILLRDADGSLTRRLGPSKEFRSVYRMLREEAQKAARVDPGVANAVKERSLMLYQNSGILITSTALSVAAKRRLNKQSLMLQTKQQRKFHQQTIKDGMQINLLIKDRKAGTNVGAGHGVHG